MPMAKVCIDPGHGGYDPGAIGPTGRKEKDITLSVALKVSTLLLQAGVATKLTRDSDRTPWNPDTDLQMRCDIANEFGADLFLSIHCNSAKDRTAQGIETFIYTSGGLSEKVANAIQRNLVQATGLTDRGVKARNLYVLRETHMPAVLVELAFISNNYEEKMLSNDDFQQKCANAIAAAVLDFFDIKTPQPMLKPRIRIGDKVFDGILVGDKTYGPVRAIGETLGYKVIWDEKTYTVTIMKGE